MKRNVFLADCLAGEVETIADVLRYNDQPFEIQSHVANWKRTGILSELKRYGTYFAVGFRYFLNRRKYEALIGWQQFYALIFCFFCSFFHVKKTTFVVALNYTYKEKTGKAANVYRWFMGKCTSKDYLDFIHVPSENYADVIASEFQYPRERIIVSGFGVNDAWEEYSKLSPPTGYTKDGYALAIGRSNRDYDFLIRAWEDIEYPLVIISDTYKGSAQSDNIVILRNVAGEESYPWIANCGLMVIPIDDPSICSGDTVLLTAMAAKRKIIVTAPSTLAEMYVVDGENALLVAKNEKDFAELVDVVINSDRYISLGEGARKNFLKAYSRQSMGRKLSKEMNI